MKITSIDVFLVTIGQPSVPGSPWNPVVVRINTEDGISGYGEVGLAYGDTKESAVGMCRDFAKLIIGMDAMNNEAIWARLHNTFWGLGGGPVVYGAMSAIDIALWDIKGKAFELHPKSWTRKSTKGVQKSMGKELFSEELKLAVVQYVLEGHTRKEASEKFCVSCTPIEKWVNLYKLHGAKGLLSRNLVGRQKGFDGEFRLKVLQYKQEHHLSCTQTAMHFCLDVVTVCRWEKKFQKEGAQGLMKKQATKGSEKRQKKQEQSELQQENKRLSEENYRLKMENDYLKKLNALIQKREKPE